jgi:hypothetical protein
MKKIALYAICVIIVSSCSRDKNVSENTDINIVQEINMDNKILNFESTRREGGAHSGKYYSSVDTVNQFAVGYEYVLPDTLKKRNVTVYVSCWVREKEMPFNGGLAIALSTTKGTINWHVSDLKKSVTKANEWVFVKDSIFYEKAMLNDPFVQIGVVGMKQVGSDALDIDDLKINYKFSE